MTIAAATGRAARRKILTPRDPTDAPAAVGFGARSAGFLQRIRGQSQDFLKSVKALENRPDDTSVISVGTTRTRRLRRALGSLLAGAAVVGAGIVGTAAPTAQALSDTDWLAIVNAYRAASGLAPITGNATWSSQAEAHSCYMLQNGISHDEIPGRPGYTSGGDIAGNSGNVAVSSAITATPRDHIELWLTGPFHAIGILRHNLRSSGFGLCAAESTPTPWRSGATLDVIRGIDGGAARPAEPIVFPGDGSTTPLHSFVTEYPNPMTLCGWTGQAGLPLIAMMPNGVSSANSTLVGPSGSIETCTLHPGNTGADGTARAILNGDNAVVVMPRAPLADGVYTVTVESNGGTVTWSFTVDRGADPTPAAPPEIEFTAPTADPTRLDPIAPFRLVDSREGKGTVRLRAGSVTELTVAPADTVAVSANFTAIRPAAPGFITAYNCSPEVPTVSTLGYRPGPAVANQAIVPVDAGRLCIYSYADVDIVIDVNGYFRADDVTGAGFSPITPARLLDTRDPGEERFAALQERRVRVAGVPGAAPADADAVALNVTAVRTGSSGWLQAYPCDDAADRDISSVNFGPDDARPNSVVVPVDANGEVCLLASVPTDVLVDITGYFGAGAGLDFVALEPVRLLDTREVWESHNPFTGGDKVTAGRVLRMQIAGERGVPADARAVSINLTAVQADRRTFMTAYPCGTRPDTSNLNLVPDQKVTANGAMVKLNDAGELCIYVDQPAHVIVDISGIWR